VPALRAVVTCTSGTSDPLLRSSGPAEKLRGTPELSAAAKIDTDERGTPFGVIPMNLDTSSLLGSLAVSSVGFVLLSYGKKMTRGPHMLAGLTLLIFPYFIDNVLIMFVVAALIVAALWLAVRQLGW
jgi:hypothetical protein